MKIKVDLSWEKPSKREVLESLAMVGVVGLIIYLVRR